MDLDCPRCKTRLPFCLATGRHIIVTDLTKCPKCHFPAIKTEFNKLLLGENPEPCPMCGQRVDPESLEQLSNAKEFLTHGAE
ncbi:unnamed protein product [Notodromas monacha]|uniref:IFT121-like zinc finger domain-containing protein n=1 Tax=Notodromas monacha TaxID=399045 RepID=A0A7R9BJE6_9CRUS|nr:unnamed protein product [Notodromas monacha]CAG0916569.1 unnamed protein product [Notodromas monacha]